MTIQVNPDDVFHVVRHGTVITLSLDDLDAEYQRDAIADETLIWQEGFEEWMRLDTLLYTLEQQDGPVDERPQSMPDVYYVMVAPEEVKQMSLDLLADAYRLDVIDDDTMIWQPGYAEWIPIRALLGEEDAHVSIAPSIPPTAVVTPTMGVAPEPFADSLAPAEMWTPPEPPRASPWYARSLVFCAVLGATFVSYRAGLVEAGAHEFEQQAALERWESRVGAPGADTVQGLDRMLTALTEEHRLDSLSETDPIPEAKEPAAAPEEKKADPPEDKEPEGSAKELPVAKDKPQDKTASAFANTLQGKPKVTPTGPARPVKKKARPSQFKFKGDANDPMNGSL